MLSYKRIDRGNGCIAIYAVRDGKIVSANPLADPSKPTLPVSVYMTSRR